MWLITTDGFVSVVKKGKNAEKPFCVRSRDRKSINNVIDALAIKRKIWENAATDYEYRIFISEDELKSYMIYIAENIDYDNFKDAVHEVSPLHAKVYHSVWFTLLELGGKRKNWGRKAYGPEYYADLLEVENDIDGDGNWIHDIDMGARG